MKACFNDWQLAPSTRVIVGILFIAFEMSSLSCRPRQPTCVSGPDTGPAAPQTTVCSLQNGSDHLYIEYYIYMYVWLSVINMCGWWLDCSRYGLTGLHAGIMDTIHRARHIRVKWL